MNCNASLKAKSSSLESARRAQQRKTSAATIKSRDIGRRHWSSLLFPLTPALSLRERGNRRQSAGESGFVETFEGCAQELPLPKGEGWGEGEADVRRPSGRAVTELLCHCTNPTPPGRNALDQPQLAAPEDGRSPSFIEVAMNSKRG